MCYTQISLFATVFQADFLDEPETGDVVSGPQAATRDTHIRDSTPKFGNNQHSSFNAKKRKVIDIPMI